MGKKEEFEFSSLAVVMCNKPILSCLSMSCIYGD